MNRYPSGTRFPSPFKMSILTAAIVIAPLFLAPAATAQDIPPLTIGPSLLSSDQFVIGTTTVTTSPSSTQEELPGLGHKFELLGGMMDDSDPENATNDTVSLVATPTTIGLAFRNLPPGIKITALTNQLGLKYYFVGMRTCGGGSPRTTLLIDADGDGKFDFAAHGHVNPLANFTACPSEKWMYENLTDDLGRWEITPGGAVPGLPAYPYVPWKVLVSAITSAFPNHKVQSGFLLDGESCAFFPLGCGKAHFDLVTIENRTLENRQDTVKGK